MGKHKSNARRNPINYNKKRKGMNSNKYVSKLKKHQEKENLRKNQMIVQTDPNSKDVFTKLTEFTEEEFKKALKDFVYSNQLMGVKDIVFKGYFATVYLANDWTQSNQMYMRAERREIDKTNKKVGHLYYHIIEGFSNTIWVNVLCSTYAEMLSDFLKVPVDSIEQKIDRLYKDICKKFMEREIEIARGEVTKQIEREFQEEIKKEQE